MIVEAKNIEKKVSWNQGQISILKGVSFNMQNEASLAIVGPSGSGKTTLLSLLAGLDRPTKGSIRMGDVNFNDLSEKDLMAFRLNSIGIVFQQFHLMPHLTALENVSLPLDLMKKSSGLSKAKELLSEMGLKSRLGHLPAQLSGGECQRVAIARAFVGEPSLLLADEPTGNLDTQTGLKVMDLLFQKVSLSKTRLILVTHDMKLAERCDKIIRIEAGQIKKS